LGNKNILRTKDYYDGVSKAEIEDLLRETLIKIVRDEYGVDTSKTASEQSSRPIIDLFSSEIKGFSKYRLAKAYVRWTRDHKTKDLFESEIKQWKGLIENINKSLK